MSRPSATLILAASLAHEGRREYAEHTDRQALRDHWRSLSPEWRRYWRGRAQRVLERVRVLGREVTP